MARPTTLATGSRFGRATQTAFTLLEVVLVLALLVAAAALSWPVVERTFASARLRKAADLVRGIWATARVDAMSYGRTHAFVCREGSGEFNYDVWTGDDLLLDQEEHAPTDESLGNDRFLPRGLSFVSVEAVQKTSGPPSSESGFKNNGQSTAFGAGNSSTTQTGGASSNAKGKSLSPILFFADGTTSDARLVIANTRGRQIAVTLRGLTGVALVGAVEDGETRTTTGKTP